MSSIQSITEIKRSGKNFRFFANVLFKSFKILFRSDRTIRMIHASFSNKLMKNSTVIKFRFRNALWYEFDNVKTIKREFSIPRTGFLEKRTLIVHGFFTKKKYILTFDDNSKFDNRTKFCQSVENLQNYDREIAYPDSVLVRN